LFQGGIATHPPVETKITACAVISAVIENPYLVDFPIALMHLVQSSLCTLRPFSITSVFCRFGLNVRLVARWEKER
jgi:hypothetical protein